MRFSSFFLFATAALAAPTLEARQAQPASLEVREPESFSIEARQGTTPVTALLQTVNELKNTVNGIVQQTVPLLNQVKNNVGASVDIAIRTALKANLDALAKAFAQATQTILQILGQGLGGIIGITANLTQAQVDQLAQAVQTLLDIINNIKVVLTLTATNLTPDLAAFLQSEIKAVTSVVTPFVQPVFALVDAVLGANAAVGLKVDGLLSGVARLSGLVNNLLNSLGLPSILIPILQTLGGILGLLGL